VRHVGHHVRSLAELSTGSVLRSPLPAGRVRRERQRVLLGASGRLPGRGIFAHVDRLPDDLRVHGRVRRDSIRGDVHGGRLMQLNFA